MRSNNYNIDRHGRQCCPAWLAKEPPNLKEVKACLALIAKNGDRAHHVIDGIRAMFLKERQEREFLDINQIIRETLEFVRVDARKKRIALQSELGEDLRPVFGNRIQLQQVMLNLFANAIEAMDGVAIGVRQIRVSSTSFAPESVLITVADTGLGFVAKDVNHIFDPFFTTKSQGMGMGLAICRSLVEAHNGKLSARPGDERGAVFEITLPVGAAHRGRRGEAARRSVPKTGSPLSGQSVNSPSPARR